MNARPPILVPPPILALLLLAATGLLAVLLPPAGVRIPYQTLLGYAVLTTGVGIAAAGFATFKRYKTPVRPGAEPLRLVTTGPYRFTRNPMYLGLLIVLVGCFFITESLYFLIPPLVFFLTINLRLIPFEEELLADHFGEAYAAYCRRVRRWL